MKKSTYFFSMKIGELKLFPAIRAIQEQDIIVPADFLAAAR